MHNVRKWKCNICGEIIIGRRNFEKHKRDLKHFGRNNNGYFGENVPIKRNDVPLHIELERREKLSIIMKKYGGKRYGSGRGKKGWYKGYYCDSSWELAYVVYNIDHNIKFERYNNYIEYEYKNCIHKYYPDFILEDGTLIEIKGYRTNQWEHKEFYTKLNNNLIVIDKNSIQKYIDYCIDKYGTNYVDLYKNNL